MPDSLKHLLLVEDETPLRQAIAEQLGDRGYRVEQAESGEAALAHLADFAFDIIVTDLRLPGIDGCTVIEAAVARYPHIIAIVVTGFGTVKDAVEAIKRGAWDFVSKPFQIDELLHVLDSAIEQRRLKSENAYLRSQLEERYRFEGIVGKSRPMERLFQLLETVAPTNSTILITGETGTGKEVVARAIHHNSPRRAQPFRRAELQRDPGNAARGGVVRPRARRVHGCGRQSPGTAGAGAQGHAVPRRSRDDERGAADEAAARAAGARVRARRRFAHDQGGRPRDRGNQQRPGQARRRRTSSARICSTGSTSFRCSCRRCASARKIRRCWFSISSRSSSASGTRARWGSAPRVSRSLRKACGG